MNRAGMSILAIQGFVYRFAFEHFKTASLKNQSEKGPNGFNIFKNENCFHTAFTSLLFFNNDLASVVTCVVTIG